MPKIEKEKLVELLKEKNITSVARTLNVCTHTIYKYMKKYNLSRKKDGHTDLSVIGKKYHKLTVLSFHCLDKHKKAKFLCKCDCGNTRIINISSLKRNLTKSCGCDKIKYCRSKGYKDISYTYFRRFLQHSKDRLINVSITIEDVWNQLEKQNHHCYYSGVCINFHTDSNKATKQTASIDRIDPRLGYTKSNIVIVHKRVNYMKGNMQESEFKYWINELARNIKYNPLEEVIFTESCLETNREKYEIN